MQLNKQIKEKIYDRLAMFPGEYECHITVELGDKDIKDFKQVCEKLDANFIIIVLDSGDYPRQPMLAKVLKGKVDSVMQKLEVLYHKLAEKFSIVRIKLEASIDNLRVPESDQAAKLLPDDCYFEHHIRMCLENDANLDQINRKMKSFNGHLSNNALSKTEQYQQRFVTQRFRQLSKYNAEKELQKLLTVLQLMQINVDKVIQEFNIFDSNSMLDTGWENV